MSPTDKCALCGVTREEHKKSGRRGLHKFAEMDPTVLPPGAPDTAGPGDRARSIAVIVANFIWKALPGSPEYQRYEDLEPVDVVLVEAAANLIRSYGDQRAAEAKDPE